jgi:ankyrin repeat protein
MSTLTDEDYDILQDIYDADDEKALDHFIRTNPQIDLSELFFFTAYNEKLNMLKVILRYPDINPNYTDNNHETILMKSLIHLENPIINVKILLQYGVDPNIPDNMGETPLHVAVRNNYYEIAELLLKYNADIHKKNRYGESPLDIAEDQNNQRLVGLLLSYDSLNIKIPEDNY